MSTRADADVLVVGAGISGLAAALRLQSRGLSVRVLDAADAPGGVMRSDRVGEYLVERGPNSLLLRPALIHFLHEFGLLDALVKASPASRLRSLMLDGELVPAPLGPLDLARSPLLSRRAKWRLLAEPFVPGLDARDESVASFVARRLGPEVATRLVGAFLTGVYAGDERKLEVEAVFPSLVAHERHAGSIVRGALREAWASRRRPRPGPGDPPAAMPGTWSHPEGLGGLAAAIAGKLEQPVELGTTVNALEPDGEGFRCEISRAEGPDTTLAAPAAVLAVPAHHAAPFLESFSKSAAKHAASVRYAPLVCAALGLPAEETDHPIEGFGFLIPRAEDRRLLGCLFPSQLFPERAPEGRELLHAMLGGVRTPELVDESEESLAALAKEELDRVLGLRSEPEVLRVTRWRHAVAQPELGHTRKIRSLRASLEGFPRLEVAGGWLDGVSLPDALGCGLRAGERIAEALAAR